MEVLIIGAGIGGLTLGLMLHRAGIACRIFEAAPELKAVGVGINILPHASRELCALGLEDALAKVAVTTREYCLYNRYGQYIYRDRKSTRLNSSHVEISYAVFCLKKKKKKIKNRSAQKKKKQ